LLVQRHLAIRSRPLFALYEAAQAVDVAAAAQVARHIVDKVEQVMDGLAHGKPHSQHKIDHFRVQAGADDTLFVFIDEVSRKHGHDVLALVQPADLGDERLAERGDG
jgi:hypothetical protein